MIGIGRRSNGNGRSVAASPEAVAAELAEIEAEISRVELAGPPLDHRITQAVDELDRCEQHYRAYGFAGFNGSPDDRRNVATGALMVIGRDALVQAERERITRQFEAAGSFGLSPAEKVERLSQLRQRQRRLLAQYELLLRSQEKDGELVIDPRRSAEMFLLTDADLEREAA